MSFAYSLNVEPKTSSPLARNRWNATDLPAVALDNTSMRSIDQVGLAHDRLRAWLDEEDAVLLLGTQDRSKRKCRRTKRQNQKKVKSLGRVKDLQVEAGVFEFEERDKVTATWRKRTMSGVSDRAEAHEAVARAAVDEELEISEASQHHNAALHGDASLPRIPSEPAVDNDNVNNDGDIEATHVSVSGRKRSLLASDVVEKRRKRYRHDFYSN